MPTLRGYLSKTRTTPVTISYFRKQMKQHQDSPSKWNIYPLQDLLDMDEKNWSPNPLDDQINNPSNPKNQWKWRMRVTIESLTAPR
jgi:4-alpha-glucanotransferase